MRIGIEVAVSGTRSSVRLPDFTVLTEELAQALEGEHLTYVMSNCTHC
ncbi:MAG: hypothetical protein GDA43_16735 [Hormoscilla sp. SP5CHS1]|nr:hypothetical protein [Hormoscilla sp. SP5CHS1]